ncbi:MAG: FAD binding domain-containing protein [Deltaproteobacteria bacterium]|nr:FAD binding domain-containing protein [Deltaproteobacteria bacterium]
MKLLLPTSLEEACGALKDHPQAIPMAGATDLMVHWPSRFEAHEGTYLDLSAVEELRQHRFTDDALVLGGSTTYWQVMRDPRASREFPLLLEAARQVGAVQIQTRGTWAGNIVNASPAADGVPVLMAYDAEIELVSHRGEETVPLSEFYLGYKKMRRRPDQLIRAIRLPRRSYEVEIFEKVGSRQAQAITKVGVAVTHSEAGWRVVANSVAASVCRCPALEALLGHDLPVTTPDHLLPAIERDVSPIDDIRSTAEYRRKVLARVLFWALKEGRGRNRERARR